ncbi:MAG TPA: hypothetical protein PK020_04120 [Ilumatobacteraceae bacterium]|nr:hypothetical protein [Ilumatobacteraceae bacterium]
MIKPVGESICVIVWPVRAWQRQADSRQHHPEGLGERVDVRRACVGRIGIASHLRGHEINRPEPLSGLRQRLGLSMLHQPKITDDPLIMQFEQVVRFEVPMPDAFRV